MEIIKKELVDKNVYGDMNRPDEIYVELKKVYASRLGDTIELLNIFHIQIPENKRKQGLCTQIISVCEEIAREKNISGIYVGPFVTDDSQYIIRILEKKNYERCMPFGMIKYFSEKSDK